MSWSKKKTRIFNYPFVEGKLSPNIYVPDDMPIATHYFTLTGTITVTTAGTTNPLQNLWPVLCNLIGLVNWNGKPISGVGTGRGINGIPAFFFWFKNYIENSVASLNSGDAMTAALTAKTYNVNFTIPIDEYDPKWSEDAQGRAFYRGVRYGRPFWNFNHGSFAPAVLGNPDVQSYLNTATTPVYTTNLTMTYSVDYVTNLAMNKNDPCLDYAVEYLPAQSFGANISSVNNLQLSLLEMQGLIYMANTSLDADGIETGVNNLAVGNGGLMDTKFGGTIYDQFDTNTLQNDDQKKYFSGSLTWSAGNYVIDQINRSTKGLKKSKTFLGTAGTPYVDAWAGAIPAGATTQSMRLFHYAPNLSASFKQVLGSFGPWGGR